MRFLRYALGEIALVVIGILIALQINNWNEGRVEQKQIREFALNLADAIDSDLAMLGPVEMQIVLSIRQAELFAAYVRETPLEDFDNAELYFLTDHIGYRPYGWNRAAIEQLKASGGLRQMRNRNLAQRISDYDSLTRHLDQDYSEDEDTARAMQNEIDRLVDRNYPAGLVGDATHWEDGFTREDVERRLSGFRDTEAFLEMANAGLEPLSKDPLAFRRLANINLQFADSARPRPDIELPRLRRFAMEIQALIDAEYR